MASMAARRHGAAVVRRLHYVSMLDNEMQCRSVTDLLDYSPIQCRGPCRHRPGRDAAEGTDGVHSDLPDLAIVSKGPPWASRRGWTSHASPETVW